MVERQVVGVARPIRSERFGALLRALERVESVIGALLVLGILVLVMIQVIARFTPWGGWVWTGEIARFGLVWIAFVLAGYLLGRDQHITLDVFEHVLSERAGWVLRVFANVIIAVICIAYIRDGLGLMDAQSGVRSPAANLQMSIVYGALVVGFALTLLRALLMPFGKRNGAPKEDAA